MAAITNVLRAMMQVDPSAPVLDYQGSWYDWASLGACINDVESMLTDLELPAGARVGVLLRNRPGQVAAALAVLASDRCLVTLNPLFPDERLNADIGALELPVIVGDGADLARAGMAEALDKSGAATIEVDALLGGAKFLAGREKLRAGVGRLAEGVAIEMLTSGTTGVPKRVPLTQAAFDASFAGVTRYEKGRELSDKPKLRGGYACAQSDHAHWWHLSRHRHVAGWAQTMPY